MGLRGFEDRLERLVEGSLTMPFRGPMQPIEISHRMLREMDLGRRVGVRGLLAPNHFAVAISKDDLDRFEGFTDALVHELAESARQHAVNEGYTFTGPVEVELFESKRLKTGRVDIVASFFEGDVRPCLVLADGSSMPIGRAHSSSGGSRSAGSSWVTRTCRDVTPRSPSRTARSW